MQRRKYLHVIQRSETPLIEDHNLREFLAYVFTLTSLNFPTLDNFDKNFLKNKIKDYYNKLSTQDKNTYYNQYQNALNF